MEKTGTKKKVLVLGSGNLAEEFIKITQRNFSLTICARNEKRVQELRMKYSLEIHDWDSRHTLGDYKNVVNTIGSEGPLVSGPQNRKQEHNLFVDLAEPSPFRHLLDQKFYWSLEDIFEYSKLYGEKKKEKVEKATQAIKEVAEKRRNHFVLNLPFGWEELQFA
jgi:glutamyl-tRNA reductase